MPGQYVAFVSYARLDDQHDDGWVSEFCGRLSGEVRMQTGDQFSIFQDRKEIAWGQNWQKRIDQTLDAVTLLLVILTPGFFRSSACRAEVERFLERERELGRDDLILPVYYVDTPEMDNPERRDSDELAQVLGARHYADWRDLRFQPLDSKKARKAVARLASRMRDAYWSLPTTPASGLPARVPVGQTEASPPLSEAAVEADVRIDRLPDLRADLLPDLGESPPPTYYVRTVPLLLGSVTGQPMLDDENVRDYIPLPAQYVRTENAFMIRVKGEAMSGEGVLDGDYVIVDARKDWEDGDMVVVAFGDYEGGGYEDGVTVKRVSREGRSIRLESSNPAFPPIDLEAGDEPIILGKVTGVVRWHVRSGRHRGLQPSDP